VQCVPCGVMLVPLFAGPARSRSSACPLCLFARFEEPAVVSVLSCRRPCPDLLQALPCCIHCVRVPGLHVLVYVDTCAHARILCVCVCVCARALYADAWV